MSENAPFQHRKISLPEGESREKALALVESRLREVRRSVERRLGPVDVVSRPTNPDSRSFLLEEACELYWNELSWEGLTHEEEVEGGALTEMVFPGLLAFVDALLPVTAEGAPDRERERRDVVHDFLLWLAARVLELRDTEPADPADRSRARREEAITDELLDLVAYRLYGLTSLEIEDLEV